MDLEDREGRKALEGRGEGGFALTLFFCIFAVLLAAEWVRKETPKESAGAAAA